MKRLIFIVANFTCVLLHEYRSESKEILEQTASKIIIRASNFDVTTRSTLFSPFVFTGNIMNKY